MQFRMFVIPTHVKTEAPVLRKDFGTRASAKRIFQGNVAQVIILIACMFNIKRQESDNTNDGGVEEIFH